MIYGDGSRPSVLKAAGVNIPRALVVCYSNRDQALKAVHALRMAFPTVPIYASATSYR